MKKKLSKAHIARANRRMFQAVVEGKVEDFKQAVKDGANTAATRFGYSVGQVACRKSWRYDLRALINIDVLIELLRVGVLDKDQVKAASMCIEIDEAGFDALYEVGIDRTASVLHDLIFKARIDLWNHCKDRLSEISGRSDYVQWGAITPLHLSLLNGSARLGTPPERIDALLDAGCGIEDLACGDTPLLIAIKKQDINAVEALLRRGARTDISDGWGYTLDEVLARCDSDEIKSLVTHHRLSRQTYHSASNAARARL